MNIRKFIFALLIILSLIPRSWAWGRGGGFGFRGGWGFCGSGAGIYLGGPWWPYADAYDYGYPAYAYEGDLYSGPYYAQRRRVYVRTAQPPAGTSASSDDNSPRDLTKVNAALTRARKQLDFAYQDGDMSKTERNAGLRYLNDVQKLAYTEVGFTGLLSADQEYALLSQIDQADPSVHRDPAAPYPTVEAYAPAASNAQTAAPVFENQPHNSLRVVTDLLLELRTLLNLKLKDGSITKMQYDAETSYLDGIDLEAHADAKATGSLTPYQEDSFTEQLHKAYYSINHNFISN